MLNRADVTEPEPDSLGGLTIHPSGNVTIQFLRPLAIRAEFLTLTGAQIVELAAAVTLTNAGHACRFYLPSPPPTDPSGPRRPA